MWRWGQVSISSTFYEQLLLEQILKVQKTARGLNCIFALLGSAWLKKAARKTLMKLTPGYGLDPATKTKEWMMEFKNAMEMCNKRRNLAILKRVYRVSRATFIFIIWFKPSTYLVCYNWDSWNRATFWVD